MPPTGETPVPRSHNSRKGGLSEAKPAPISKAVQVFLPHNPSSGILKRTRVFEIGLYPVYFHYDKKDIYADI